MPSPNNKHGELLIIMFILQRGSRWQPSDIQQPADGGPFVRGSQQEEEEEEEKKV